MEVAMADLRNEDAHRRQRRQSAEARRKRWTPVVLWSALLPIALFVFGVVWALRHGPLDCSPSPAAHWAVRGPDLIFAVAFFSLSIWSMCAA
jgi:hypothetical protein